MTKIAFKDTFCCTLENLNVTVNSRNHKIAILVSIATTNIASSYSHNFSKLLNRTKIAFSKYNAV